MTTTFSANRLDTLKIDHEDHTTWPVVVINNTNGEVIWKCKAPDFKVAVEDAIKQGVSLVKADFRYLDLFETRFTRGVDLSGADFSHCRLGRASFEENKLRCTTFDYAHLTGTQFIDCDMSLTSLSGAWLTEHTDFDGTTWHGIAAENIVPVLMLLARRIVVASETIALVGSWSHEIERITGAHLFSADELLDQLRIKSPKHFKKYLPVYGSILVDALIRAVQYEKERHAPQVAA